MYKSIPHGGRLISRIRTGDARAADLARARRLPQIPLAGAALSDFEMIANGALSPLTGFMTQDDYESVLASLRLHSGLVWSLPITLAVSGETAQRVKRNEEIALTESSGGETRILGLMRVEGVFQYDKAREAERVFQTTDAAHPGVARLLQQGDFYVGGEITLLNHPAGLAFPEHRLPPARTRELFAARGWRSVVGFQTRNPIHRAHEYIQKCALEIVDGLLLHPLVGATKSDDISAEIRMHSYQRLLEAYYPQNRVLLSVFPASMRYAGPREAIFHALCRKNYGCTHFIVGRDHAGVGNYYGTYDAQKIFRNFSLDELGIVPLFFEHSFFCKKCDAIVTQKTCPHDAAQHMFLSGTQVREMLGRGEAPPEQLTRPEVARVLIAGLARQNAPVDTHPA